MNHHVIVCFCHTKSPRLCAVYFIFLPKIRIPPRQQRKSFPQWTECFNFQIDILLPCKIHKNKISQSLGTIKKCFF